MKNIAFISALAVLVLSRFTNAAADPSVQVPSEAVHFTDLDITHGTGAATLYQRLELAASDVCSGLSRDQGRNLSLWNPYHVCMRSALRNAVASINSPALTALAAAHGIVVGGAPMQLARRN
jgi:UrcA family protein